MTTTTATMPALPVQLSEKDRHVILDNVLATLRKRFYAPEKLNGEWQAAVNRHRSIIESAVTADAFEQSMSDLLAELHTSHLGFFHNTGRRASSRAALSATYLADKTPYGNRWIFQDVHSGGAAALAGIVPGNILLKVDAREIVPPEHPVFPMGRQTSVLGEKTAGRLLSATSVKVGNGFRLALPTGAFLTWKGKVFEGTPIEPDQIVEFDWRERRLGRDRQLDCAVNSL